MTLLTIQLSRFVIAGLSAVGTDLVSYYLLLNILSIAPAKGLSFMLGTVVAYLINKFWTFEKPNYQHQELVRFILLYTMTLGLNIFTNSTVGYFLPGYTLLAFLAATAMSTIVNFMGQKWWVFR